MKTLLLALMFLAVATAWTSRKSTTKCHLTPDKKAMESHPWKPKGPWHAVCGMKKWCKLNCVRCNVACPANC